MKKIISLVFLIVLYKISLGQTKVAITIDDVPNSKNYAKNNFESKLFNKIEADKVPVAIFVNENQIYKTNSVVANFKFLDRLIKLDYITLGNHTFNHSRYSKVGFKKFKEDIIRGEAIIKELSKKYAKNLTYFRFPYNDLGKDLPQKNEIHKFLKDKGYVFTPFTIESSDWMFNILYEYYLNINQKKKAQEVADLYISKTIAYFKYFRKLSLSMFNREINQIYLCHDNTLNSDCIDILINELKKNNYILVSLDEAMKDEVYKLKNNYSKKWGISWFYRWMNASKSINQEMRNEPDLTKVYKEYKNVMKIIKAVK